MTRSSPPGAQKLHDSSQGYWMSIFGSYPRRRMRRMRRDEFSRRLRREHRLTTDDLIYPVFVIEGKNRIEPVPSMPGIQRYTVDRLLAHAEQCVKLGLPAVAIFPMIVTWRCGQTPLPSAGSFAGCSATFATEFCIVCPAGDVCSTLGAAEFAAPRTSVGLGICAS